MEKAKEIPYEGRVKKSEGIRLRLMRMMFRGENIVVADETGINS